MITAITRLMRGAIAAGMLLAPALPFAQPVPEHQLKAAFVYNFALFTEWPPETGHDSRGFNLCISPANPLHQPLSALGDKTIHGKKVALRNLPAADVAGACHLLVIGSASRERWTTLKKGMAASGVLVVTDDEALARDGAAIALAMADQRVVFDINLTAARHAGLTISSKLLRLARTVN